jgi:hypothetical protein
MRETKFMPLLSYRLYGLVVRISDNKSRVIGLDFRMYQIFLEVVGLERSPFRIVRITEELLH